MPPRTKAEEAPPEEATPEASGEQVCANHPEREAFAVTTGTGSVPRYFCAECTPRLAEPYLQLGLPAPDTSATPPPLEDAE